MDENQSEKLESDLAYMDRNLTELSKIVFEQQKQIDALSGSHRLMVEKLAGLSESNEAPLPENEKPPHY
jgi:uncharacterized coiled-coil protein SlyX